MLHELHHRGLTIVVSTPYMDEAEYASRIGFLDGGRLVDVGTRAELLSRFDRPLVSVATHEPRRRQAGAADRRRRRRRVAVRHGAARPRHSGDSAARADAIACVTARGWRDRAATDVEPIAPSLEDVFVLRSEAARTAA